MEKDKREDYIVGIGEVLWDLFPGGKEIKENFKAKKLESFIYEVLYPTGVVEVELDGDGVPKYIIKEDVAWDNIPFMPALKYLAQSSKAVSFGSLAQRSSVSRDTIIAFIQAMPKEPDCYKIFDINLRQNFYTKEVLLASLKLCNVFKINDEELDVISDILGYTSLTLEEKCQILLSEYNLNILILTCGVKGSYVFTSDQISFIKTPKVKVVDTVGAGDSFTAAFISAILKGKAIEEAHQLAVDFSAYVCTQKGAMPAIPAELKKNILI